MDVETVILIINVCHKTDVKNKIQVLEKQEEERESRVQDAAVECRYPSEKPAKQISVQCWRRTNQLIEVSHSH